MQHKNGILSWNCIRWDRSAKFIYNDIIHFVNCDGQWNAQVNDLIVDINITKWNINENGVFELRKSRFQLLSNMFQYMNPCECLAISSNSFFFCVCRKYDQKLCFFFQLMFNVGLLFSNRSNTMMIHHRLPIPWTYTNT